MTPKTASPRQKAASPGTPPVAPADATWSCETSGGSVENLTVGQIFNLKCSGAEVPGFNAQTLSLELPKADKYRLRILENKASSTTGVELGVTSYVPGDAKLQDVILTDGVHRVSLTGVNFLVKSVINQEEPPPKPFPPEAPLAMRWPTSTIVALVLGVLILVFAGVMMAHRRRSKKKFKAWLAANRTPLSPFDQLNKDLRRAQKERAPREQIVTLEVAVQTYLARLYEMPLMKKSPRAILKVIARGDKKTYAKLAPLTTRLFGEFERIPESLSKSQLSDAEALNVTLPQIHELIREFAERVESERANRRGGRR